jgi:uncharacterized lipoprotein YehR (DUF1307 family)
MKKKFFAVVLMLVMLLSLVSCGKKKSTGTYLDNVAKMTEIKGGSTECKLTVNMEKGKISELTSGALDTDTVSLTLKANTNADASASTVTLYANVLGTDLEIYTITYLDKNLYIDASKLKDSVTNCGIAALSQYAAYIPSGSLAVVISEDELQSYVNEYASEQGIDSSDLTIDKAASQTQDMYTIINLAAEKFVPIFNTAFNSVTPAVFSTTDGKAAFTVNNDNYVALINALITAVTGDEFKSALDSFVTDLGTKGIDDSLYTQIKDGVDKIKTGLESYNKEDTDSSISDMEQSLKDSGITFSVNSTASVSGSDAKQKADFSLTADIKNTEYGEINASMTVTNDETGTADITAPSDAMTVDEFKSMFSTLLGY